jgi:hypothetical protein
MEVPRKKVVFYPLRFLFFLAMMSLLFFMTGKYSKQNTPKPTVCTIFGWMEILSDVTHHAHFDHLEVEEGMRAYDEQRRQDAIESGGYVDENGHPVYVG